MRIFFVSFTSLWLLWVRNFAWIVGGSLGEIMIFFCFELFDWADDSVYLLLLTRAFMSEFWGLVFVFWALDNVTKEAFEVDEIRFVSHFTTTMATKAFYLVRVRGLFLAFWNSTHAKKSDWQNWSDILTLDFKKLIMILEIIKRIKHTVNTHLKAHAPILGGILYRRM